MTYLINYLDYLSRLLTGSGWTAVALGVCATLRLAVTLPASYVQTWARQAARAAPQAHQTLQPHDDMTNSSAFSCPLYVLF